MSASIGMVFGDPYGSEEGIYIGDSIVMWLGDKKAYVHFPCRWYMYDKPFTHYGWRTVCE